MNLLKLVAGNVLVLCLLLAFSEMGLRAGFTVRSCLRATCDYNYIDQLKLQHVREISPPKDIGLTRFDEALGYVPREGFDAQMIESNWEPNARVTIRGDGFRLNNSGLIR